MPSADTFSNLVYICVCFSLPRAAKKRRLEETPLKTEPQGIVTALLVINALIVFLWLF